VRGRVLLIPLIAAIPGDKVNPDEAYKLQAEGSDILAWAKFLGLSPSRGRAVPHEQAVFETHGELQ
jgi:hypothetical protein